MNALMLRFADSPFGVFAILILRDNAGKTVLRLCTGEDDWLNNQPHISCIPAGTYNCKRVKSPRFGNTFEITGVPGRGDILFHSGNTEENTEGCVYVGADFGALTVPDEDAPGHPPRVKWGIAGGTSKPAFEKFLKALTGVDLFSLEVRWSRPGEWRA